MLSDRPSAFPDTFAPSPKLQVARVEAELAAALQRRDDLEYQWAVATYSSSGARSAADVDVELARLAAQILELEERRAALRGAPAEASALPAPLAPIAPAAPAIASQAFLDTAEAATLLGVSVKTLESLRARSEGPPFVRVGRRVRYEHARLLEWARQK